jgi:hypothetical protein
VHGESTVVATHDVVAYFEDASFAIPFTVQRGAVLNVESTQSGVFCTATIVSGSAPPMRGTLSIWYA